MRSYGAPAVMSSGNTRLLLVVYLVAGAIVAALHHYYAHLHTARQFGSAVLAIVFWPLLYLGINLHIH